GMDRALQQQGVKGKGTELIANWRTLETAYIEELAKEHIPDFERANVGSHKYMKVRQYKEYAEMKSTVEHQIYEKEMQLEVFDHHMQYAEEKVNELQMVKIHVVDKYKELEAVEQQVKSEGEKLQLIGQRYIELEKKVKQQQEELDSFADQVPNEPVKIPFLRKEVITEVQDKMFGKAEITKKQTRNYVLSPEQYQKLTKQVNAAGWMEENRTLKREKSQLQKEVRVLNSEINSLKARIEGLQANIRVLYEQTKTMFKEKFKAFRGIIKNELDIKGVDNQFEQEHKKEINKHRGFDMER
ncbi:mobilization protein, partial [Bacillus pseudomycoides]|nr:mobilization protein [Bacillus pseudomycoides]